MFSLKNKGDAASIPLTLRLAIKYIGLLITESTLKSGLSKLLFVFKHLFNAFNQCV